MTAQNNKVGIVVDRNFGSRIPELARLFHVWVVESPRNTPVIQQFWETTERASPEADPFEDGITSFEAEEMESAQEMCERIAEDVDNHHGEFAHDPPWSEIEVYGVSLDEHLRKVFEELGATLISPTSDGFICRR